MNRNCNAPTYRNEYQGTMTAKTCLAGLCESPVFNTVCVFLKCVCSVRNSNIFCSYGETVFSRALS